MKDKILNMMALSKLFLAELESVRNNVAGSDISNTSKESLQEFMGDIRGKVGRIDSLLEESLGLVTMGDFNLAFHERRLIVIALKRHKGNKHGSARDLKISGRTIFRKLKEHNIMESEYLGETDHEGRLALSSTYKDEYNKMISFINYKKKFWLTDLKDYMKYGRTTYSPAINIIDYLSTKNLIQCSKRVRSGKQYKIVRPVMPEDLIFVETGRDKKSCFA